MATANLRVPYPPQAQAPYPPQPGFPQQGGPYAPMPPQPQRKLKPRTIKNIVIIAVALVAAVGGYPASRNPDLEVVDCGSSKAQYVVLAKIDGTFTSASAQISCETKAKDFQYAYMETKSSDDFLLCLKDYSK